MIRKLRLKFICVIMSITMVLLAGILGIVIHFTGRSMEMQSINMMRTIAGTPFQKGIPGKPMTMKCGFLSLPLKSAVKANLSLSAVTTSIFPIRNICNRLLMKCWVPAKRPANWTTKIFVI